MESIIFGEHLKLAKLTNESHSFILCFNVDLVLFSYLKRKRKQAFDFRLSKIPACYKTSILNKHGNSEVFDICSVSYALPSPILRLSGFLKASLPLQHAFMASFKFLTLPACNTHTVL